MKLLPAMPQVRVAIAAGLGLVLRLIFLSSVQLTGDETFTGVVSRADLSRVLQVVSKDSGPPLSYLLAHFALQVNDSAWGLRAPSVMAGVAVILVAAALGTRLGGRRVGEVAALVAAVLPALVLSSRDARMYALAAALVGVAVLFLWRFLERPSAARWLAFTAFAAAALYTHYFTAFPLVGAAAAGAVALRVSRRALAAGAAGLVCAGLSLVPWLLYAGSQFRHEGFWVLAPNPIQGLGMLTQVFAGPYPDHHPLLASVLLWGVWGMAVVAAGVATGRVLATVRDHGAGREDGRRALVLLGGTWVATVVLLLAISIRRPVFEARYATVALAVVPVVVGMGLAGARRVEARLVLAVLGAASLVLAINVPTPDVRSIAAALPSDMGPADTVALVGARDYYPLAFYAGSRLRARVVVVQREPVPWYFGTAGFPAGLVQPDVPPTPGRVFLVFDPAQPQPALGSGFGRVSRNCHGRVCLEVYRRQ